MGFLRRAEKTVWSSRRNGGFFLSAPLSEALTEVALGGVEHGGDRGVIRCAAETCSDAVR